MRANTGLGKTEVMLFGVSPARRLQLQEEEFRVGGDVIRFVMQYKYLGILHDGGVLWNADLGVRHASSEKWLFTHCNPCTTHGGPQWPIIAHRSPTTSPAPPNSWQTMGSAHCAESPTTPKQHPLHPMYTHKSPSFTHHHPYTRVICGACMGEHDGSCMGCSVGVIWAAKGCNLHKRQRKLVGSSPNTYSTFEPLN